MRLNHYFDTQQANFVWKVCVCFGDWGHDLPAPQGMTWEFVHSSQLLKASIKLSSRHPTSPIERLECIEHSACPLHVCVAASAAPPATLCAVDMTPTTIAVDMTLTKGINLLFAAGADA